jgi:hypothetical protein
LAGRAGSYQSGAHYKTGLPALPPYIYQTRIKTLKFAATGKMIETYGHGTVLTTLPSKLLYGPN